MNLLHRTKRAFFSLPGIRQLSLITTAVMTSPAFADGFTKASSLMDKISTGLMGLAVITITVAVCIVGYKVLWDGKSIHDCKNIIIGGILIASASEIGSMLAS
jgi:type IV secretion system protein VirB2